MLDIKPVEYSIIRFQDYNNKSYNLLLKLLDLYLQSLCE